MNRKKHMYQTIYTDKIGSETTKIINDGHNLSMKIRGFEYKGFMFDDFEPIDDSAPQLAEYYKLECDIPIMLGTENGDKSAIFKLELYSDLDVKLISNELSIDICVHGYDFEDVMTKLREQLPAECYFKNCFGCQYADYGVFGQGLFGCMQCFRNHKKEYLNANTKNEYIDVPVTEQVQEIYICPEFRKRAPKTGYRD